MRTSFHHSNLTFSEHSKALNFVLMQLRGRNGQNHSRRLERRKQLPSLRQEDKCADEAQRAQEWGQMVIICSMKYDQRSC